jgi:RNA polymerase sporulation-specific sigma factor
MELPDEELVTKFQGGEEMAVEVLIERFRDFAKARAKTYFLVGADAADVEQEAMIGLYMAARDFRIERGSPFRAFAQLCVSRRIVTAIKARTRRKHQALNQSVSVWPAGSDDRHGRRAERVFGADPSPDPATYLVSREQAKDVQRRALEHLSALEADVLRLHVQGYTYQEISERICRHVKAVDNTLQRVKRKLAPQIPAAAA